MFGTTSFTQWGCFQYTVMMNLHCIYTKPCGVFHCHVRNTYEYGFSQIPCKLHLRSPIVQCHIPSPTHTPTSLSKLIGIWSKQRTLCCMAVQPHSSPDVTAIAPPSVRAAGICWNWCLSFLQSKILHVQIHFLLQLG